MIRPSLIEALYTHGPNLGHRSIHSKSARLDELIYSLNETVIMNSSDAELNDVAGSRSPLAASTSALVGASDGVNRRYYFALLSPGFATEETTSI